MIKSIEAMPLTKETFAPFGDVIEKSGSNSFQINNGKCTRHHAMTLTDVEGDVGVSIFSGTPYPLPHKVDMVERHPLGSQAFYPLGKSDWLIIVCEDIDGKPINPRAFLARSDQGINLKKGQWHGVLTPLYEPCDFLVIDRCSDGENLQEHFFDEQFSVTLA